MFGGFDKDSYDVLGDTVMGPIRAYTNLRWVGFYLSHGPLGGGSTWTKRHPTRSPAVSTWRFLKSEGWGMAPVFVGRQFGADAAHNPNWTRDNGIIDGQHAVALANANDAGNLVDIELGATLYIDLEADGFASVQAAVIYLRAWFDTVRAAGYRPGVYCLYRDPAIHLAFESDGKLLRQLFPDVAIWFVRVPGTQPKVYEESTGWLTVMGVQHFQEPDGSLPLFGYVASQYAWYNDARPPHTFARLRTGSGTTHNVAPIDFDASRIPDPSHPEDRSAIALSAFRPGAPAAFALAPNIVAWQFFDGNWGDWGQGICQASDAPLADFGHGKWFDMQAMGAASRQDGLIDIFGTGIDGAVWTAWRTPDQPGGPEGVWSTVPQLIAPTRAARHGSAIAAVSRRLDVLDVFYFNVNHELATTWWNPGDQNWLGHNMPITAGFGFAPASNIEALVSPTDTERLDVFAIDSSNTLRWVQWRNSGAWQNVTVPLGGAVDPAIGVYGAWFGGQMHLVVGLRDGTLIHLRHPDGNLAVAWETVVSLPNISPFGRPVGVTVDAVVSSLIAALVTSRQTLVWLAFENGVWGAPGFDAANPPYSSSGRIVSHRFDDNSLDIMLPNHAGLLVMRRLSRSGVPLAPMVLTGQWEMVL